MFLDCLPQDIIRKYKKEADYSASFFITYQLPSLFYFQTYTALQDDW